MSDEFDAEFDQQEPEEEPGTPDPSDEAQPVPERTEAEEQAIRDHFGYTESEKRSKLERDAAATRMLAYAIDKFGLDRETTPGFPTEEEYVAREMEITRLQMESGKLKEVIVGDDPRLPDDLKNTNRMQRCERYARWRYHAFMRGEVGSL